MSDFDLLKNDSKYKAHLDDIGVKTLPNQPGKRGYSAEEVKLHFKAPIDYLYQLMKKGFTEAGSYLNDHSTELDTMESEIESLRSDVKGAGMLFVPAMQSEEPDESKVKVWLETELQEGDVEEMSFSKEVPRAVAEFDPDANELTFTSDEFIASEPEGEQALFDDSGEKPIFEE